MKKIPLSGGRFALLDDRDFKRFGHLRWCASGTKENPYPMRREYYRPIYLHRAILGITDSKVAVDHKNHNTLDCRRKNLRACSWSQNLQNRKGCASHSSSGIRGVHRRRSGWSAVIVLNRKAIRLGYFKSKRAAAVVVNKAREKLFGEFAGRS